MGLDVRDESIPIRSRRQRIVKARVRDDDDDARHSSQDSGCGEHYSPTNIAEAERYLPMPCSLPVPPDSSLNDERKQAPP